MRIPKYLKKGDTIGLCAPSFGAGMEPYITRTKAAITKLEEYGYHVAVKPSTYKSDGLGISTDPEVAARELMELYLDDYVDGIISVGGGELMCETMSHVDFGKLCESDPKWFMGYSDNTNFLYPMVTLGDVPGIYGPCVSSFGKPWEAPELDALGLLEGTSLTVHGYDMFESPLEWQEDEEDIQSQEPAIGDDDSKIAVDTTPSRAPEGQSEMEEDPLAPYAPDTKKTLTCFLPARERHVLLPYDHKSELVRKAEPAEVIELEGTLLGGCLDVLEILSGTPYDGTAAFIRRHEKIVWALEACDYNVMSIRRALWHLRSLGWFDSAAGFIIGRPLAAFGQEMMGVDQYNAVTGILGDLGVPIIMDADIGHVKPVVPVILGSHVQVRAKGDDLSIAMQL